MSDAPSSSEIPAPQPSTEDVVPPKAQASDDVTPPGNSGLPVVIFAFCVSAALGAAAVSWQSQDRGADTHAAAPVAQESAMETSFVSSEEFVSSEMSSVVTSQTEEAWLPPTPPPPPASEPSNMDIVSARNAVGVYLSSTNAAKSDFFDETLDAVATRGGNALVVDVKGGAVYFDADAPLAKELKLIKKQYELSELLAKAHERGVYVIARFVALKDAGLARTRPDTLIAHPQTHRKIGYEFVDPENETTLQYNREILCSLARSGIDEINLDYIRFSTEQVGELRVFPGAEKARKVGIFVQMARQAIDECGDGNVKLGLSTYAILGWNYAVNLETLGQDVVAFAPYVDIISPMAYPFTFAAGAYYNPATDPGSRNYFLVYRTLTGYRDLLGPEHAKKIRPWIQGYSMSIKDLEDQMKAVADAGSCGFTVWSANNIYGNTYKALASWKPGDGC